MNRYLLINKFAISVRSSHNLAHIWFASKIKDTIRFEVRKCCEMRTANKFSSLGVLLFPLRVSVAVTKIVLDYAYTGKIEVFVDYSKSIGHE